MQQKQQFGKKMVRPDWKQEEVVSGRFALALVWAEY